MEYLITLEIYGFINNKNIVINFDKNINIFIGKNGCGKTTIFRIINNLLDLNINDLILEPFKKIILKTNKKIIEIEKNLEKKEIYLKVNTQLYTLKILNNSIDQYNLDLNIETDKKHIFIPLTRSYTISDFKNNFQKFSLDELKRNIERRYRIFLMQTRKFDNEFKEKTITIPLELINSNDVISNITKLLNFDLNKQTKIKTIFDNLEYKQTKIILETLFKEIENTKFILNKYNIKTQPELLSAYIDNINVEENEKFKEISKVFDFVNNQFSFIFLEKLLEIFKDTEQKKERAFSSFKTFEKTLNTFFSENKKNIFIDQTGELKIESLITKNRLNIESLSSGEKQLITLFGYIIFDARRENIILIDEPELSLHIDWQMNFTESLINLNYEKQYLLATHSPEIIGGFSDKCIWIGDEKC